MKSSSSRWVTVSDSEFAHERAGLDHVRDLLPDRAPYRAWSNFEFRDTDGKWHEVDLLVLGEGRLHLVELKSYRGVLRGNAYRWQRGGRSEDSPLLLARRKAQRLKSVITRQVLKLDPRFDKREVPFVAQSVFLHSPDGVCELPSEDRADLYGLDGYSNRSHLPSIAERLLEAPDPTRHRPELIGDDGLLAKLFDDIGFAVRREREVGSWRLTGPAQAEGDGWQDWPAEHRLMRSDRATIRFYVSPPGSTAVNLATERRRVEREFQLTGRMQHEGVLHPSDLVDDELGMGLVYREELNSQRLDLWLADRGDDLRLDTRLDLVRQLTEALGYAHRHGVVHRGLTPRSIQVVAGTSPHDSPQLKIGDWHLAGRDEQGTSDGSVTSLLRAWLPNANTEDTGAYAAPEGRLSIGVDRIRADVFALGAVAYTVISGRPPATDAGALRDRLRRESGLDLTADLPAVPDDVRTVVLDATRPDVGKRFATVAEMFGALGAIDLDAASGVPTVTDDPLDIVVPGAVFGDRFQFVRRLGSGSTAVGLLVLDREHDDAERVLKVARDDAAADRLAAEAEVLRTVNQVRSNVLVRLLDDQPLQVGSRTALLLDFAGPETLADALRSGRSRLSLDLLQRWGIDLLQAVVALDRAGVDHRDIKPANLGVRERRGDRTKHLVLFDFSLSTAGTQSIRAGTPPYLDPFLGTGARQRWDSAAERYAAAATLLQMASGDTPRYGDGISDPTVIAGAELALDPEAFDPSVSAAMISFFGRALARSTANRFDTAAEMLAAWESLFDVSPVEDADALAAAATASTPLREAGLSARAVSAIEPENVTTVGELAALDPARMWRMPGVAMATRDELRARAKQWRAVFGEQAARTPTTAGHDLVADAEALSVAAASSRAPSRSRTVRAVLGLEDEVPATATLADLERLTGLSQAQISRQIGEAQDLWAADRESRHALDAVAAAAANVVSAHGGLLSFDDLAASLTRSLSADVADQPATHVVRVMAGLLRFSLDRAEGVEQGGGDAASLVRRRRRRDGRVLVAVDTALLDVADTLGAAADELVAGAAAGGEPVVPAARAADALAAVWPRSLEVPSGAAVARVAAAVAKTAAVSHRDELYDHNLAPDRAVAAVLRGAVSRDGVQPSDLARRVATRFPALAPLPVRPTLDAVVERSGLELTWNGTAYAPPAPPAETTGLRPLTRLAISHEPVVVSRTHEDTVLIDSRRQRSFLALGVAPRRLDEVIRVLLDRYDVTHLDVTARLLSLLRTQADQAGIDWARVQAADAAGAGTRDQQGLDALVTRAVPTLRDEIAAATSGGELERRPVLLTELAPLARYGHLSLIAALADIGARRDQAVWAVVPTQVSGAPTLDGSGLPLAHAGQFLRLTDDWLRAGEPTKSEAL